MNKVPKLLVTAHNITMWKKEEKKHKFEVHSIKQQERGLRGVMSRTNQAALLFSELD